MTKHIIVGISGASGAILGIRTLEALREASAETHRSRTPEQARSAIDAARRASGDTRDVP